jgi:hypothetical protein
MARGPVRPITVPAWWADEVSHAPFLVELTAKRWKALMLVSAGLMVLGLLVLGWQMWSEIYRPIFELDQAPGTFQPMERLKEALGGFAAGIGWALLVAATGVGLYARFMAWWRHG